MRSVRQWLVCRRLSGMAFERLGRLLLIADQGSPEANERFARESEASDALTMGGEVAVRPPRRRARSTR